MAFPQVRLTPNKLLALADQFETFGRSAARFQVWLCQAKTETGCNMFLASAKSQREALLETQLIYFCNSPNSQSSEAIIIQGDGNQIGNFCDLANIAGTEVLPANYLDFGAIWIRKVFSILENTTFIFKVEDTLGYRSDRFILNPFQTCSAALHLLAEEQKHLLNECPTRLHLSVQDGDGPQQPHLFRWKERSITVSELQWKLISFLWKKSNKTARTEELYQNFWSSKEKGISELRTNKAVLNRMLMNEDIPWQLTIYKLQTTFKYVEKA